MTSYNRRNTLGNYIFNDAISNNTIDSMSYMDI